MLENELLIQISKLLDEKFETSNARLKQELREEMAEMKVDLKTDIAILRKELQETKDDVRGIKLAIEHEIRPQIKLLAENYMPAAERYVSASREMEYMKVEIDALKLTVVRHSKQLAELTQ